MMKLRAGDKVTVRSLHRDFAPIGEERVVTEGEASMLVLIGRAVRAPKASDGEAATDPAPPPANTSALLQPEYKHREMLTQQRSKKRR